MPNRPARSGSERDDKSHETDRPPFPTVTSAAGISHGRPPKIHRFPGLVKPTQPAHTMIQIQPWQDYTNDAMRLDRINFGGVR